jgi:hypothetical protein
LIVIDLEAVSGQQSKTDQQISLRSHPGAP